MRVCHALMSVVGVIAEEDETVMLQSQTVFRAEMDQPEELCPENEVFSECGSCGPSCAPEVCTLSCSPQCACQDELLRRSDGECVLPTDPQCEEEMNPDINEPEPECTDGEVDNTEPCSPAECIDGKWSVVSMNCEFGGSCAGRWIQVEGECCLTCDINEPEPECTDAEVLSTDPCAPADCIDGRISVVAIDCGVDFGEVCAGQWIRAEGECCPTCKDINEPEPECTDGEVLSTDPCAPADCIDGRISVVAIDCGVDFGDECAGQWIRAEGECCPTCEINEPDPVREAARQAARTAARTAP